MAIKSQSAQKIISEVKQQYEKDLQRFLLKNVKRIPKQDVMEKEDNFREGAYGKVVDLTWGEIECVGKVLYPIFFSTGTETAGMRCLLTKFFREIKLLSEMKHPNIVKFLGIIYQQDSSLPVLVMEKMECNLTHYLGTNKKGSIPQKVAHKILLDVSNGLVYLHEDIKVAHRDLSSNNILLGSTLNAKIADLGSARVFDKPGGWDLQKTLTVQPGVLDFMPPETLSSNSIYTASIDVFSFACVIIHLCTHKWPTPDHIEKGKYVSEIDRRRKYITEMDGSYLMPILMQCLDDLSPLRPSAREIMMFLRKTDTSVSELKFKSVRDEKVDYTIVFAGITGAGKSSAGNFFLNKKVFKSKKGLLAVTDECTASTSTICGKKIKIIDTPGFFDGFKSTEENFRELSKAFTLAKDGIHAVVFVMNYNRFTTTCEEALQQLLLFKGIQPYLFVLLTQTETEGITKEATNRYIAECLSSSKCPEGLKNLMQKVNSRVIMLESVGYVKENYQKQKSIEFINMVESIFKTNNNKMYTNLMLRLAAEAYEGAKNHQANEIQKIKSMLKSNLEKIAQFQEQINSSAKISTSSATNTIGSKIAELKEQNKKLENYLKEVEDEAYLENCASNILKELMAKSNIEAKNLSDFIKSFAYYLGLSAITTPVGAGILGSIGAVVGGGIGAVGGSVIPGAGTAVGAVAGAQIGGTLGGLLGGISILSFSVKDAYDDCNQQ